MESCFLCDVCTRSLVFRAMPWIRQLAASLSLERHKLDTKPVHMRFVMDKVALGQVFLQVYGFPLSVSFHHCSIHLHLNITHIRISSKAVLLWISRSMQQNSTITVGLSFQKVQVTTFFNNLLSSVKKLTSVALHYSAPTLLHSYYFELN